MKYIISGGGTGGHIYPALAILDELKKRDKDGEFLYIGTPNSLEKELAEKANYKFKGVRVMGMPRNLSMKSVKSGFELLKGLMDANKIIKQFKPDFVIGTGGYVSFPVLFMAQRKGIKTLVQEQNAFPGKANKILSKNADAVAIAFEEAKDRLGTDKCFVSGNPIRPEFMTLKKEDSRRELDIQSEEKIILSFGGSGGQESINDVIIDMLKEQKEFKYSLIHITGKDHYENFMESIRENDIELAKNIKIVSYAHNLPVLLSASDLAILSSSAISLAEVSALGLPSILIPKAYTAENHQEYNARSFEKAGASKVFLEKELNSGDFYNTIEEILENNEVSNNMGEVARKLSKPNSTELIVDKIFSMM